MRTAWLFGAGGPNFVATMLRLGAERDEVTVVTDQRGGPTWTGHLAAALVEVAEREGDVGLFHASGSGECSWYEFAVEIFDRARLRCRVVPTTTERFARPARRPAYSVLGTEREPGIVLPPWQDGLAAYLAEQAGPGRRPHEAPGVWRGGVHRLELRASAGGRARRRGGGARQAHLRGAA